MDNLINQCSTGAKGRGATGNPLNRFERLDYVVEGEFLEQLRLEADELPSPQTLYLRDASKSIIAYNDSADIGFAAGINPYRGCEHGCVYCFARPTHEYLGFSAGLDFETRIMVKEDAPELLRAELAAPKWRPQVLALSGVTDCYQPLERATQLTRRCLEVLAEFRNPVGIVTKSALVLRDADVLGELARHDCARVALSLTSLDQELKNTLEPRAAAPHRRLETIRRLTAAGIPAGAMIAPIIPGLNDHEIPRLVAAAAAAGALFAGYVMLRLPHAVKDLFAAWLERHHPLKKDKVLNRIRAVHGGKLYDAAFGKRMRGAGPVADQVERLFRSACRKAGLPRPGLKPLSLTAFRRPETNADSGQLQLF